MAFSVNTNVGAMAALQSLNATNRSLETVQSRINTGLAVGSTKDDSAKYTIAQKLRGDIGSLGAVTSSLSRAKSTVDVAIAGAEQVSDLVNQMKAKITEAADAGLDGESRTQIVADMNALKKQIRSTIESSEFNGTNLLTDGGVSALQSLDSTSTDGNITVAAQGLLAASETALGAEGADIALADAAAADALKTLVEAFETTVKNSLSALGSGSRQIDGQLGFVSKLSDVIESGIGNLVDADLAKESANLQALQVKQQLGLQALSIANQAPQSIISLFR